MACKGTGKDNRRTELPPKYRENGLDLSEEGRSQSKLYIKICNYDILALYIFRVVYNSLYRRK